MPYRDPPPPPPQVDAPTTSRALIVRECARVLMALVLSPLLLVIGAVVVALLVDFGVGLVVVVFAGWVVRSWLHRAIPPQWLNEPLRGHPGAFSDG